MLEDISQLQEIVSGLYQLTRDPNMLSATTEQAIVDMKGGGASVDMQSILSGHSGRVRSGQFTTNATRTDSPFSAVLLRALTSGHVY